MLEALAWLLLVSSALAASAAILSAALGQGKENPVHVACYPAHPGVAAAEEVDGYLSIPAPHDLILAQTSHDDGGWTQTVSLQQRVRIPLGYIGVLTVSPQAFRMTNGRTHTAVTADHLFLMPGWEGDLNIFLMNRHNSEPAVCERGTHLATLSLVSTATSLRVRTRVE